MSMVIVGYIVYAILSPRTGLMNQIISSSAATGRCGHEFKILAIHLTVVNIWKGIGMGSMMALQP